MTEQTTQLPIHFDADGLVPAVIQDAESSAVLMIGFMNEVALRLTRETSRVHFWSRSRAKLWRKGETSGHEQIVQDIFVNCEQNSLLIAVTQIGAVCHDGYPTCYYRRLDDDNTLTVVRDRWFDPATVYGAGATKSATDPLVSLSHQWFGAYEYLRDHDLSSESSTSRRLQTGQPSLDGRIADELRELAGVLNGTHRHRSLTEDLILEGSQVLYWIALAAVRDHISWDTLRPDAALRTAEPGLTTESVTKLLLRDADGWASFTGDDRAAQLHATVALIGQACLTVGLDPVDLLTADTDDLQAKPYLANYFALHSAS